MRCTITLQGESPVSIGGEAELDGDGIITTYGTDGPGYSIPIPKGGRINLDSTPILPNQFRFQITLQDGRNYNAVCHDYSNGVIFFDVLR